MSRLADSGFVERLIGRLNADERFATQTLWFDGSILLQDGGGQCWMKVYRGKVIDHLPFMPPFGYTFKLSAPDHAWEAVATGGTRKFNELFLGGRRTVRDYTEFYQTLPAPGPVFQIEGTLMEAFRIVEAIYLIAENFAAVAGKAGTQA